METKLFYLVILFICLENFGIFGDDNCKNEPRCKLGRTRGMRSLDCYKKEFRIFPKCITSDAEIIELSENRIRKVTKTDLSKFSNLKILYLKDNLLSTLQNDTFEDMGDLVTLDLSQNNIKMIPNSIFHLPSLQKLYISQNQDLNMAASIESAKPILSPISMLDMSFTTEEYSMIEFPLFGTMPYLVFLNMSENQYQVLMPKHFAGLCSLERLININVSNRYEDDCDCWVINKWLKQRNVQFDTFDCNVIENECLNKKLNEEDKATYNQCIELMNALKKDKLVAKISIGVGISLLVIIILLCCVYFCFIRNRRRNNNNNTKKSIPLNTQPEGPLLKHNNVKTSPTDM